MLQGTDPYASGLLHQPPLVLLPSVLAQSYAFPFDVTLTVLLADVIAALAIASIVKHSGQKGAISPWAAACLCAIIP